MRVIEFTDRFGKDWFIVQMDEKTYRNCVNCYKEFTSHIVGYLGRMQIALDMIDGGQMKR